MDRMLKTLLLLWTWTKSASREVGRASLCAAAAFWRAACATSVVIARIVRIASIETWRLTRIASIATWRATRVAAIATGRATRIAALATARTVRSISIVTWRATSAASLATARATRIAALITAKQARRFAIAARRWAFYIALPITITTLRTLNHWLDVAICTFFRYLSRALVAAYHLSARGAAATWRFLEPHYERHLAPHVAFVAERLRGEEKWIHAAAIGVPGILAGAGLGFLALALVSTALPGFALLRGDDLRVLAWVLDRPLVALILVPVVSELVFRVYLVRYFALALSPLAAVVTSAALYGFARLDPVFGFAFALAMSGIHARTRTILVPIVVHVAYAATTYTFATLFKESVEAPLFTAHELRDPLAISVFLAMAVVGSPGLYWATLAIRGGYDEDQGEEPGDAARHVHDDPYELTASGARRLEG